MKNNKKISISLLIIMLCIYSLPALHFHPSGFTHTICAAAQTPLTRYGRLKVSGSQLVNSQGKTVQLKGVSTHGLSWYPQYVN